MPFISSGNRRVWILSVWLAASLLLLIVGLARGTTAPSRSAPASITTSPAAASHA
ncbi:MAG TPA: hypothetical protein VMQ73_12015 [Methylomirabilota bacterium]|nr:hypothetical protein [Methylomirabilota bacterium]